MSPQPFTRLYIVVSALTLAFGAVDLCVATPFLLIYEAPITNALTGLAFVVGAFGEKPMLMEVAQARPGASFPDTGETRRFFRLFTLALGRLFLLKVGRLSLARGDSAADAGARAALGSGRNQPRL